MRLPFFHAHIRETGAQRRSDFHHDERIQGEKTILGLNGVARRLRKSPTRSRILQRWNKGRENTSSVRFTRRMARVARRVKLFIPGQGTSRCTISTLESLDCQSKLR